ncbi:MAG: 50S ribosomal protein L24 [Pseudomonadota bacterium]
MKFKLKKGDKVIVTTGKDKGNSGVIEKVLVKDSKVIVTGINMVSRHVKGKGIEKKTLPIHISNVMILDPESGKPTRIRVIANSETGKKERFAVKSNKVIG